MTLCGIKAGYMPRPKLKINDHKTLRDLKKKIKFIKIKQNIDQIFEDS